MTTIPVTITGKGTRPGDPLADLIFGMVFAMFHVDLCAVLEEQGLSVALPKSGVALFGLHDSQ